MTGIYDIYCYGAAGTTGEGGDMRASRAKITKGTILNITVGGKPPAYSYGGSLGEGHTRSYTSYSCAAIQKTTDGTVIGQSMNIYQRPRYGNSSVHWGIGSGRRYRGYPDGGWGDLAASPCDNGNHTNQASIGYGGGGSSFVSIGCTKVISGKGGYGGGASNERICGSDRGGTARAGVGGGVTCLNSTVGLKWLTSELNLVQRAPDANGSITITVVKVNPEVTLVQDITDSTNQLITLTATVTSVGEGLPAEYLSWEQDEDGNDIWTDSTTYTVSNNGTYTCKIRDVAGNIEKASIRVMSIMKPSSQKPSNPSKLSYGVTYTALSGYIEVEYSGYYDITCAGPKGASYNVATYGGSVVTTKAWLNKGDILYYSSEIAPSTYSVYADVMTIPASSGTTLRVNNAPFIYAAPGPARSKAYDVPSGVNKVIMYRTALEEPVE